MRKKLIGLFVCTMSCALTLGCGGCGKLIDLDVKKQVEHVDVNGTVNGETEFRGSVDIYSEGGNGDDDEYNPGKSQYYYLKDSKVGEYTEFGDNGSILVWKVLKNDGETLTLITDTGVSKDVFHMRLGVSSWGKSYIRGWLNNTFLNSTFSSEEQSLIKDTPIEGEYDKVFLLSVEEAEEWFESDEDRILYVETRPDWKEKAEWWLRDELSYQESLGATVVPVVAKFGEIRASDGSILKQTCLMEKYVRPAINIDLTKIK